MNVGTTNYGYFLQEDSIILNLNNSLAVVKHFQITAGVGSDQKTAGWVG